MLKLGLESGDQEVIDKEQKGIDLETASLALKALKRAGIGDVRLPAFRHTRPITAPAARKTLDFTVRHADAIDFLNLAIFNMPIHSPDTRTLDTSPHYDGDLFPLHGVHPPRRMGPQPGAPVPGQGIPKTSRHCGHPEERAADVHV